MRRALPLCLLVLAAACEGSGALLPRDGEIVDVHAVLRTDTRTATVVLRRLIEPDRVILYPLEGAQVSLLRGPGTIPLAEASTDFPPCIFVPGENWERRRAGIGCYNAWLDEAVRPGEQIALRAVLPDGRTVQGSTTVPQRPDLLAPAADAAFPLRLRGVPDASGAALSRIPVRWRWAEGGARVEVTAVPVAALRDGQVLPGLRCEADVAALPALRSSEADSLDLMVFRTACRDAAGRTVEGWDHVTLRLIVTAYDEAYARYMERVPGRQAVRLDAAGWGVEGAIGVFSAGASAERTVTLRACPGPDRC